MEFRKVSSGKVTKPYNRYSSGKIIDNAKKNPQPKFESSTSSIKIKWVTTEPNLLGDVYHRR